MTRIGKRRAETSVPPNMYQYVHQSTIDAREGAFVLEIEQLFGWPAALELLCVFLRGSRRCYHLSEENAAAVGFLARARKIELPT